MTNNLPKRLDHCPKTPECVAKVVYQASDGTLYRHDATKGFVPHVCTSKGTESTRPMVVYTSEWLNNRTGRTRHQGPMRMEKSALLPPPDKETKRRGSKAEEWTLVSVHRSFINNWERIHPKE